MSIFKPPSEMVERVGEALSAACMREFGATWNYDVRQNFARAAIEAMREPTEEMCSAAAKGLRNLIQSIPLEEREPRWGKPRQKLGYCIPHNEKHRARWQAMIDAAL